MLAALGCLGAGCGKEIGDTCQLATDCDPDGSRFCDLSAPDGNGYCTIMGCDYDTCPSEAACIQFFTGEFENRPCNHLTEDMPGGTDDCSFDELCDLEDHCVPRSSEIRYCMRKCDSNDDCRDGYECRDLMLMEAHGGEPVMLAPGEVDSASVPGYCAPARGSNVTE